MLLNCNGGRLGRIALGRIVRDYGAAAGIPRLHPHALRPACATHLIKGGADLAHVQKILGHSQITTTAEYVKLVVADLKKLIETKHPSERRYRKRKSN